MIKLISLLAAFICCCIGCRQPASVSGPAGYNLAKPETIQMPGALNEISGIAFNKGMPDTIFAEQDEEGKIFAFVTGSKTITHRKFGKKGDYEDIAIAGGITYILRSDGIIFSFPLQSAGEDITNVQELDNLLPKGEYEGMYADENTGLLYILCKSCNDDNANKSITVHVLQINVGQSPTYKNSLQLNTKDIAAKMGEKKLSFRPSALARNTVSNEWYIVSSVNRLLVVADDQWVIKAAYPLDPVLFPQPEGIAFDKDNTLYISNEAALTGKGTVLRFTFTQVKK